MAKQFHLITVGKLKDSHLEAIENDYLKRINNPELIIHELKASAENKIQEGESIIKKIGEISQGSSSHIILMSEWGKNPTSVDFSNWTSNLIQMSAKIIFVIAGAEGFSDEVLKLPHEKISLSKMTLPHKLARIILVEQLYRAQTIRNRHPYHN